jgi:alkanesulfonate monooxygenase SsuD/methylene tetrahydromethanopterin reductase-like flavin-dependent oxidoreductase (luciferase family)
MTDYGRPIRFGYFLSPQADPVRPLELAVLADEAGLDYVGVQDHPYQRRFHDTWILMTAIAVRTLRIAVFPDVANLPLRPPAMLAKAAASLDLLSGGRFELGLGAGGFWDAIAAMGGPRRTPGESIRALGEAIEVIRLMWSDTPVARFKGDFYQLAGVKPGPQPAHPIGIWLGVYKPRGLALVGRAADGWVPSLGYAQAADLTRGNATIDWAARAAGRDPASIRRVLNVPPAIAPRLLADLALEQGMDTFVFAQGEEPEEQLGYLASDVIPRTRELVAAGRA